MNAQDPVVVGIDETIERRRARADLCPWDQSADPVRESPKVVVKTSGLRWISMMLLTQVRLRKANMGLAVFNGACAVHERYHKEHKKRHKTITDWGRQMVYQLHRWLRHREH